MVGDAAERGDGLAVAAFVVLGRPGAALDDHDVGGRVDEEVLAVDTDASPDPHGLDPDRVCIRSRHLRALGWTHVQVWMTDVFRDPAREVARLVAAAREASADRRR